MNKKDNSKIIVLIGLVVIIAIIFKVIFFKILNIDPNIIVFDTKIFYSPTLFFTNIALYTPEIRMYLLLFRVIDMFFPLFYGLLLIQIFIRFSSKHILFPMIALLADLVENILLAFKMFINQEINDLIIYIINTITITKFLAIMISIYLILAIIIKKKSFRAKG